MKKYIFLALFSWSISINAMQQLSNQLIELQKQLNILTDAITKLPIAAPPPVVNPNVKQLVKNGNIVDTINIELIADPLSGDYTLKELIKDHQDANKATIIARVQDEIIRYFDAYYFLMGLYGNRYLSPGQYQYKPSPITRNMINVYNDVEFYKIDKFDDSTFKYIGNGHDLYIVVSDRYDDMLDIFTRNIPEGFPDGFGN